MGLFFLTKFFFLFLFTATSSCFITEFSGYVFKKKKSRSNSAISNQTLEECWSTLQRVSWHLMKQCVEYSSLFPYNVMFFYFYQFLCFYVKYSMVSVVLFQPPTPHPLLRFIPDTPITHDHHWYHHHIDNRRNYIKRSTWPKK